MRKAVTPTAAAVSRAQSQNAVLKVPVLSAYTPASTSDAAAYIREVGQVRRPAQR